MKPQPATMYLGIDPGLNRTGYSLLQRSANGPILKEGGILTANRKDSLATRVHEIGEGLREIIGEYSPDMIGLERIFSFGPNPKTAITMAHLRGAILLISADHEIPVVDYSPTQIKRLLTGSGKATKVQMQHAVKNELRLRQIPEPHDVADATAIALCLYHSVRFAA
ncbi:crossover junction endodeoxyribonuclease RuvC [bacterium]|nr:crossover junction endodeoxyribonuclease RuvC [bacterium]